MQGRADAGRSVKPVEKGHGGCQDVVPFKKLWSEILTRWEENIDDHRYDLSNKDIDLQLLETVNVI